MIANRAKIGDNLAQKFETLASRVGLLDRQASNVAAWTRQARDDADDKLPGSSARQQRPGSTVKVRFAARTGADAHVTMTSTLSLTSSAAISA